MGGVVDRPGAGPLPRRQSLRPARPEIRLPGACGRRAGSDLSPDAAAGSLGPSGPHPAQQCLRQEAGDIRWCVCRPAIGKCRAGARVQSPGDVRRQILDHSVAGRLRVERSGRVAICKTAGRSRRPPAGGEFSCRRRQRSDDLARQGAHHLLRHRTRCRCQGRAGRRGGIPLHHGVVVFPRCGRDDGAV